MAKNEAKIKFTAETGTFNAEIKKSNDAMSQLRAEMQLNETQMKANGASVEGLENKHRILSAQLAASESKTQALSQKVDKAAEIFGENSTEVGKLKIQLLNAQTAEEKLKQAVNACETELNQQKSAATETKSASEQLTDTISEQQTELDKLKKEYQDAVLEYGQTSNEAKSLASKITSLSSELKANKTALSNASSEADKLDVSLENVDESARQSAEGFTILKGAAAELVADGIGAVVSGIGEVGGASVTMANDIDRAVNTFIAKTGESTEYAEGFEDVMISIYQGNYGEGFEDIADSMATVKTNLGDMDNGQLKQMTIGALVLRDTFDMDVNESTRAAAMLMNQFGISGMDAYNLIAQGAQSGLNKNGDLLDVLNEYAPHFAGLGMNAEEMFNILVAGAENGAFSVDKVGDAVKEFGIRVIDNSDTTKEAFKSIGLSSSEMAKKFAAGGDTAKEAFSETILAIQAIDDPIKRNAAGVALFGSMWEDLGEDAIFALAGVDGSISKTNKALGKINDQKYDDLGSQIQGIGKILMSEVAETINDEVFPAFSEFAEGIDWQAVGETVGDAFRVVAEAIMDVISGIQTATTWMREHKGVTIAVASAIGIVVTAIGAYLAVKAVKAAMEAAEVTTIWGLVAAHLAQAAAAMAAIAPYILIVAAIAAVIAIVILCIKYWDEIYAVIQQVWEGIWNVLTTIWANIMAEVIDPIISFFTVTIPAAWNSFLSIASSVWNGILNVLSTIWANIKAEVIDPIITFFTVTIPEAWNAFLELASTIWNGILNVISTCWENIKTSVGDALSALGDAISAGWEAVKTAASTAWNAIKSAISTVWNAIKAAVSSAVNAVKTTVTNIWNAIKTTTSTIWNGIKSVITTLWSGIKTSVTNAINAVKTTVSNIWNGIKSTTSTVWNGIKTSITNVWSGIKTGVSNSINNVKSTVSNIWNGIKSTTSTVWNGIKDAMLSPLNTAKDKIKGIVDTVKGFFSGMSIKWPSIPMPHFGISPQGWKIGDLLEGKIPKLSINWYAEGAIFKQPTLFNTPYGMKGVGEAGPEAVLPIDKLEGYVASAIEKSQNVVNMQALADAISKLADRPIAVDIDGRQVALATASAGDSVNGLRSTFRSRGLALE